MNNVAVRPHTADSRPDTTSEKDQPRLVDAAWIAEQVGCSLAGAYLVARDIGIVRLGPKRRLVRVLRTDFDAYIEQRREVVVRA